MTLPDFYYAEPQFRSAAPDVKQPKAKADRMPGTPETGIALAQDYYRVEAFASRGDRDAACGPAAHPDVRYVAANRRDIARRHVVIEDIACGYTVDHPRFDEVVSVIFDAALKRLFAGLLQSPKDEIGILAAVVMTIARTRYTIAADCVGDWTNFPIKGFAVFETVDQELMNRTIEWLHNRLILSASPLLIGATSN